MKAKIEIIGLFLLVLVSGCADDKDTAPVELDLEKTQVYLFPGQAIDVKILQGNSDYSVKPVNENVATATVSGNNVHITAASEIERANTSIVITDRQYQRAMIDVIVAKEFDLILSQSSLELELGITGKDEDTVLIKTGNFDYTIELLDDATDYIMINTDDLITGSRFSVKAKAMLPDGKKARVGVTDAKGKKAFLEISIISPQRLEIDNYSFVFETPQITDELEVKTGTGPFTVEIEDSAVAEVHIEGRNVKITSRSEGSTTFIIKDKFGFTSNPVSIEVKALDYAMKLGTDYFCHASFQDLATVDMSVKALKATTWEMLCKMNGYRGLQTFMGLEGKLIIRGKNDDYKDTHPIEIAGLGDRIVFLTKRSFDLNKWMHVALVVDCSKSTATEIYKFYIDGEEVELEVRKDEETHKSVDMTSSNDENRFEIGLANKQDWRAMRGAVSEVRIWKTARTPEQIKNNMCRLNDGTPGDLLARWNFSIGIETNYIQDSSGNPYPVNLTISKVNPGDGGQFFPASVPLSVYLEKGCVE